MATLRAFRAFDMGEILRRDARTSGDGTSVIEGAWRTHFTGSFSPTPGGFAGLLTGFTTTHAGRVVFEASGFERSAATAFEIIEERDNDRLLAYTLSGADRAVGSAWSDALIGFGGDDFLDGAGGDDSLFGGIGHDTLAGGDGDDFLAGGEDADLLAGGQGNDTYLVDARADRIVDAGGRDTVLSYVSLVVPEDVERLVLIGDRRLDATGTRGSDEIDGNEVGNRLSGGGGRDALDGDGGADLLEQIPIILVRSPRR